MATKTMGSKTPVTELQEICVSRKAVAPIYESISEELDGSLPNTKIFRTQVKALGYTSTGLGRSKKDSKHDAAFKLLKRLLNSNDNEMDVDDQHFLSVLQSDKVTEVRDICVQRNFPVPEINCVRTSGPSHAPEFEFECRIDTIVRRGVHKTKKGAKQAACQAMIKTLQAMPVDESIMQIQSLDKVTEMAVDEDENTIRTYREYKNSDIKKKLGVKICDRHKFFEELEMSKIASARRIFTDETISIDDKCTLMPKALSLKYDMKLEDSQLQNEDGQKLYCFELLNTEYDCFIFGLKDVFFKRIFDYFKNMLNFDHIG
ncbi:interferon-inducible double-stranded RNA-dependent protein kinase activator A homolog B [Toxorhynchites rutilus septentrionalis]|uniref:interferon-inducible double-stranded RNA-dependent protein kinase activator A homolog B n=1 Tax=Toxorhynchites rutilus septentrionalis TaxID=329112 RepID=UPI00247A5BCF|nr:interferon-inducible double-stranded RNA-dependent protein kinase activator A homolog B [Toxorhynchites rutilus septentrionalis]XP_055617501.1 interferon-inducible double-stranded RNA-dependent protein kinase activator A homolog B [Toxorhynchites rutilus septentrionalis]